MQTFFSKHLSKRYFFLVLTGAVLCIAHVLLYSFVQGEHERLVVFDIYSPLVNLIGFLGLLYAAWHSWKVSRKLAIGWGILALGQLANTGGDVLWGIYELILGQSPFPSTADVFYLAYYPLFLAGILTLPYRKLNTFDWVTAILDMGTVILSAVLLFWCFLVGPVVSAQAGSPVFEQILAVAYPVADLLLVWALVLMLYRIPRRQAPLPLLLVALGIMFQIIADCGWSFGSMLGLYSPSDLINLAYTIAYVLIGLGGAFHGIKVQQETLNSGKEPVQDGHPFWVANLPYIWVLSAYFLLIVQSFHPLPIDPIKLAWCVGAIFVLVLLRQIITLKENNVLHHNLQSALDQVQNQADQLTSANKYLQVEILERKRAEEQLLHDALHDALTGLPNRALLADRLRRVLVQKQRYPEIQFSLLFLDLDNFKVINDSLGHSTGDRLLISIARLLQTSVREIDTVARLSGDEFIILLEDIKAPENVLEIADRILSELNQPLDLDGTRAFISSSIGIILDTSGYEQPEDVLRDADLAMYQAKISGKSRYKVFHPNMRIGAITRLTMENDLRMALERHEFQLNYQPVLSLPGKGIVGFEALLRWNHPQHGLLMPASFIAIAEETGLIIPIGKWVLGEACRQLHDWQIQFPELSQLKISVNVSGRQIQQGNFERIVSQALQDTDLPGENLVLEITENICLDDPDMVSELIERLKRLGVETQIDDFGTGYSSLSYLQHFMIESIKIDRCFIEHINENTGNSRDVITAIMSMVHSLGIHAIAEGIETEAQLKELNRLGCSFGQGFLLATPMNNIHVENWLKEQMRHQQSLKV